VAQGARALLRADLRGDGWTYTKVNRCLAEGRKSFLERYAGIESGQECERLAPALSAFVDGEADAAQAVALRAHLRQCLACRATVPAYTTRRSRSRSSSRERPRGGQRRRRAHRQLLRRVYETVSLHLHERAANSFLRAQAVFDTVTAGKMAPRRRRRPAVAGGGFAVEGVVTSPRADRPARILRGAAAGAGPGLKTVLGRRTARRKPRRGGRQPRQPSRARGAAAHARPRRRAPAAKPRRQRRRRRGRPRAPAAVPGPSRAPSRRPPAPRSTRQRRRGEFGFEGP
jgi:hypothetical protein